MFVRMYLYILFIFIIYLNIVYIVYVPARDTVTLTWLDDLCNVIQSRPNAEFIIARKYVDGPFSTKYVDYTMMDCTVDARGKFDFLYRPVFGDHIHLGYSLYINDTYFTMRDHNMSHNVPYEKGPSCSNAPPYAYVKKWYHTGVHTHCDQIIHVHPFSAPRELRVEGRKANLGMWFENVGIFLHGDKFEIPGYGLVKLTLEYFVHVDDPFPVLKTSDPNEIQNLWLVDHQGFVMLYSKERGRKNSKVLHYKKSLNYPKRLSRMYVSFYACQFVILVPCDLLQNQMGDTVS